MRIKLNPIADIVAGKRVVLVDDSIVRGTTSKQIVQLLREAGGKGGALPLFGAEVPVSLLFRHRYRQPGEFDCGQLFHTGVAEMIGWTAWAFERGECETNCRKLPL